MIDIFKFWEKIGPYDKVHPDDRDVFERVSDHHDFDLECLPAPFGGPLRTAAVVLLYLSPGWSKQDLMDAATKEGRERIARQRTGRAPLLGPDEHPEGYEWVRSRTQVFGQWEKVRNQVAILEIGAYHSKQLRRDAALLPALPSSRVSLNWAQTELFPAAIAGDRIAICLRAARAWGLVAGRCYGSLFAPETTRGGYMKRKPMRDKIIREVKARLA